PESPGLGLDIATPHRDPFPIKSPPGSSPAGRRGDERRGYILSSVPIELKTKNKKPRKPLYSCKGQTFVVFIVPRVTLKTLREGLLDPNGLQTPLACILLFYTVLGNPARMKELFSKLHDAAASPVFPQL